MEHQQETCGFKSKKQGGLTNKSVLYQQKIGIEPSKLGLLPNGFPLGNMINHWILGMTPFHIPSGKLTV